jgi:hypothetical protein
MGVRVWWWQATVLNLTTLEARSEEASRVIDKEGLFTPPHILPSHGVCACI